MTEVLNKGYFEYNRISFTGHVIVLDDLVDLPNSVDLIVAAVEYCVSLREYIHCKHLDQLNVQILDSDLVARASQSLSKFPMHEGETHFSNRLIQIICRKFNFKDSVMKNVLFIYSF